MPDRNITITIFLFALFVFLGIFIFLFSYSAAKASGNYSKEVSKSSIECSEITFDIAGGSMSYENNELSFTIESYGGGEITKLIVAADNETRDTPQLDFRARVNKKIKIGNITIKDKFRIYPEGCEGYNIKECNLSGCVMIK